MKQQINLYLPEFRAKQETLTLRLMLQVAAGFVLVMVLVSGFDMFSRWRLSTELAELREVLVEETRKTEDMQALVARRTQNSGLSRRLQLAEARLQASRQIRDFLSQSQLGNIQGFSEYFKDIARASMDGLSINEFAITEGGEQIMLAGEVVDSAMVPRYVDNIEGGRSPLRKQHFSPQIARENVEDRYFSFVLSTTNE